MESLQCAADYAVQQLLAWAHRPVCLSLEPQPEQLYEPALGTYGNLGRNQIVGPSFGDVDRSLVKTTPIYKDRVRAQFRVEMFNVFNHTNLSPPNSNSPSLGDDDALGESTSIIGFRQRALGIGSGEPYNTQLALKILF